MSSRDELHNEIDGLTDEEAAMVVSVLEGMTNNEKFNAMLHNCKHAKRVFEALNPLQKEAQYDERSR